MPPRRPRHRWLWALGLLACLNIGGVLAADDAVVPGSEQAARIALGQRIYREGIGANGEPIVARGAAQTQLAGQDAACAVCHRRSGYGTSEGVFAIRPIIGPALSNQQQVAVHSPRVKALLGIRTRPPYTDALLARAIGAGLDASGKPLDPVMPRYALTDSEMKAVAAYLFSLSNRPSPGVDDEQIHLATVIQPGVSPERRKAMLDIMQLFVKDKDSNVRSNEQRREAGNMRMDRAYRKWVLHVWDLRGPSDTWAGQLEAHYREQPVFALVGGLGDTGWQPIHDFAERHGIPSVFPQVDLPVLGGPNVYTFYFSRGVVLEAEVLARFMRDQGVEGRVVQIVRRDDAAGAIAAAAFRNALGTDAGSLEDRVLDGPIAASFWRSVLDKGPATLVLWLGKPDVDALLPGAGEATIYLSSELLDFRLPEVAAGADVRLIYPSDVQPMHDTRLLRNTAWLRNKGVLVSDEAVQMNTQFAMSVVSDALGHIVDNFSRDYFVERVEHVVAQTPIPSEFLQLSLGPGQRFAAKGSSIVRIEDARGKRLKPLSGWIVP